MPNLTNHQAIAQVKTTSGNAPLGNGAIGEAAAQSFLDGTPVQMGTAGAAGYIVNWDGTTVTNGILGICPGSANNLLTNGAGMPAQPFGSVGLGASLVFGSVPNQPLARNIAMGSPLVDGRQVVVFAVPDTWFEAQIDNGGAGSFITALSLVGGQFGLTKDTTGHWYVDLNKTTGANTVLVIKQLNPSDPIGTPNGRVWFTFLPSASQLSV